MDMMLNYLAMVMIAVGGGFIGASIKTPRGERKALFPLLGMGLVALGFVLNAMF